MHTQLILHKQYGASLLQLANQYQRNILITTRVDVIFYFASYLTEEIHVGLVGMANGNVENTFGHYSLLMHMFLFKGVTYFGKEMDLNREQDVEALPVQLWSVDMT